MKIIKEVVDGRLVGPDGEKVDLPIGVRAVPKPKREKGKKGLNVDRNFAELPGGRGPVVVLAGILPVGQEDEERYKEGMGIA